MSPRGVFVANVAEDVDETQLDTDIDGSVPGVEGDRNGDDSLRLANTVLLFPPKNCILSVSVGVMRNRVVPLGILRLRDLVVE